MNALFDEDDNVILEHAADAIIPQEIPDFLQTYHESFDVNGVETLISRIGGSVHGHTQSAIEIEKEENV